MKPIELEERTICLRQLTGDHPKCKVDDKNKNCDFGYRPIVMRVFDVVESYNFGNRFLKSLKNLASKIMKYKMD